MGHLTTPANRRQVCAQCGAKLDVPPNTYERYGDESIYNLVVLCAPCHELFHEI